MPFEDVGFNHSSPDRLEAVIRLLEQWGWIQGDFESDDGLCLIGGLEQAFDVLLHGFVNPDAIDQPADLGIPEEDQRALRFALQALAEESNPGAAPLRTWTEAIVAVCEFNDDPTTSWEDVVVVVKRAAAKVADPAWRLFDAAGWSGAEWPWDKSLSEGERTAPPP